jgi:myo-inositol 2-dehydrogenase/D-chiro-inositol 1-dehydrogenase
LIQTDNRSTRTHLTSVSVPDVVAAQWPEGLEEGPYQAQLREVANYMAGGPPPRHAAEDARAALQIALAALESMATGRPVQLHADA